MKLEENPEFDSVLKNKKLKMESDSSQLDTIHLVETKPNSITNLIKVYMLLVILLVSFIYIYMKDRLTECYQIQNIEGSFSTVYPEWTRKYPA
jgi:hypothetical protein